MRRIPLSRRSHITGFRPLDGEAGRARERARTGFRDAGDVPRRWRHDYLAADHDRVPGRCAVAPDFRVIWTHISSELVEVKYRADLRTHWVRLRPGFVAARTLVKESCCRFRIATERGIRGPMLANARRLLPLHGVPLDPATSEQALRAAQSLRDPAFGQIVDAMLCD
jgi:hypothetical protein